MLDRRKIWVSEPNNAQVITDRIDDSICNPNEVFIQILCSHISAGTELTCNAGECGIKNTIKPAREDLKTIVEELTQGKLVSPRMRSSQVMMVKGQIRRIILELSLIGISI